MGDHHAADRPLRLVAYLLPVISEGAYALVAATIAERLGRPVEVIVDTRRSGPGIDGRPFSDGEVDLALVCAPSWCWLRDRDPPAARLVGVAPAPDDIRSAGEAWYFSEVLVRREHPAAGLDDLHGATWAVNDPASLSGYHAVVAHVHDPRLVWSGAHSASAAMVRAGRADAAAVDALAWRRLQREDPSGSGDLRAITTWGPHPTQPLVAASHMAADDIQRSRDALLSLSGHPTLDAAGLSGFAPVDDGVYGPHVPGLPDRRTASPSPDGTSEAGRRSRRSGPPAAAGGTPTGPYSTQA